MKKTLLLALGIFLSVTAQTVLAKTSFPVPELDNSSQ